MVRNKEKYEQALQFRKRGFTLEEIAKICEVSKSTVSKWLKNKDFSESVTKQNKRRAGQENAKRLKLINKARGGEREKKYREVEKTAETEYKHYKNNPLFIAGLMLYIGEGDHKHRRLIRIASAKSDVHRLFIRFAKEFLGIENINIKFWILLYPDLNEEACMKKWKKITGLPYTQFYKNQVIQSKYKKRTLHFGVGNTIIGSTVLKHKLNRWIELVLKDLSK